MRAAVVVLGLALTGCALFEDPVRCEGQGPEPCPGDLVCVAGRCVVGSAPVDGGPPADGGAPADDGGVRAVDGGVNEPDDAGPGRDAGPLNLDNWRAIVAVDLPVAIATIPGVVAPVRLDAARVSALGAAVENLNVVDEEGQRLPFEVERFSIEGGLIWVRVDVSPSVTRIFLLGEAVAPANLAAPALTWQDYEAVWHNADEQAVVGPPASEIGGTQLITAPIVGPVAGDAGPGDGPLTGAATRFDGASACVHFVDRPLLVGATEGTLSAWVRPAAGTDTGGVVVAVGIDETLGAGNFSRLQLSVSSGDLLPSASARALDDAPLETFDHPTSLVSGEWHFLAAVARYADDTLSVVRNFDARNNAASFAAATSSTNASHASIGGEDTCTTGYFEGDIDEVRVSRRALSADHLQYEALLLIQPDAIAVGPVQPFAGTLP